MAFRNCFVTVELDLGGTKLTGPLKDTATDGPKECYVVRVMCIKQLF